MPLRAEDLIKKNQAPPQPQRVLGSSNFREFNKPEPVLLSHNRIQTRFKNQKVADIVIPHHNRHDRLEMLLEGIDFSLFNVRAIGGGSFGHNCNQGAKLSETDKIIFCNDDIIISNEQLIRVANALEEYDFVGLTQIAGIQNKKKYWGIGLFQNTDGTIRHQISTTEANSLFPSGFCFGVRKDFWKKMKGLNEEYKTGNEDVDFGLRAVEAKARMVILDLEIEHAESQSTGRFTHCQENEEIFYRMWRPKLKKFFNKLYQKKV